MPGPRAKKPKKEAAVPALQPDAVLPAFDTPVETGDLDRVARQTVHAAEDILAVWAVLRQVAMDFIETMVTIVRLQKENILAAAKAQPGTEDYKNLMSAASRDAHATMNSLASLLEKLSRTGGTITKMGDEWARLRVFLTGGEPEGDQFKNMPLADLIRIVTNVAAGVQCGRKDSSSSRQSGPEPSRPPED